MNIKYEFAAKMWQHSLPGGWFFISLPLNVAEEIRKFSKANEEGWGRLKVIAKIADVEWRTSIWFDTKMNTYLLPVKADIRKLGKFEVGETLNVVIGV